MTMRFTVEPDNTSDAPVGGTPRPGGDSAPIDPHRWIPTPADDHRSHDPLSIQTRTQWTPGALVAQSR